MEDKLNKYGTPKKAYPPLEKSELPKLVTPKKQYEAFVKIKGMERVESFKIYDRNGNFDFYHYGHLLEGSFRNDVLMISTTSRIYSFTGQQLVKLAELFSEKKVKANLRLKIAYQTIDTVFTVRTSHFSVVIRQVLREIDGTSA